MSTIYQRANEAMRREIKRYLSLAERTQGFKIMTKDMLCDPHDRLMFAAGLGLHITDPNNIDISLLISEWERKSAVPFDIEKSVTVGVYKSIRPFAEELFKEAERLTRGFTHFNKDKLFENPHLLPVFQHLAGIFSKAELKN